MIMIGQLLDNRYQIVQVLGGGTFGKTFLAKDIKRPGHPECVVKQLHYHSNNPQSLQIVSRLFKQEAEILEKLGKHPQIPTLLADIEENQEFYLVQEFIAGHPLTHEILPGQLWSEEQVVHLLIEVLRILADVHQQGVIHRDIKPANLMRRQSDNQIVLIDFGAVKELTTQIAQQPINQTVTIGTPGYMPIEQFHGQPQFNSDIYALGMIGIQALLGLDANDLKQLINPSNNQVIWHHQRQIKPELANVIDKMVFPGYKQRYQSVTNVLDDLEKIVTISGSSVLGSKINSSGHNTQQSHKKQSWRLIFIGVAVLTVVAALAGIIYRNSFIAWHFYNQGVEKIDTKNYQEAKKDFDQAIQLQPKFAEAYNKRCRTYLELGNYQRAIEDCTQALQINSKFTEAFKAYTNRGLARRELGDIQGAIVDYTKAIQINQKFAAPYNNRGNAREALGDKQGAIEDFSQAIKIEPEDPAAYVNRCLAYSNINENKKAIEDCTQAININPQLQHAYVNRSLVYRRLGDFRKAIEDCNLVININPNSVAAYANRANARYDLGDKRGAIEDYTQAIQIKPDLAQGYYWRGLIYAEQGDPEKAIQELRQAATLYTKQGLTNGYNDAQYQIRRLQQQSARVQTQR